MFESPRERVKKAGTVDRKGQQFPLFHFMGFSLLSGMEFFVDPKNVVPRNKEPPAMRVRIESYTKKLPFRLQ